VQDVATSFAVVESGMHDEKCRFTLGGAALGGLIGVATDGALDGLDGDRLETIVGMILGGLCGFWIILAMEDRS
jgi:outer membrane lipoprotein SlyB